MKSASAPKMATKDTVEILKCESGKSVGFGLKLR